jgi:hypothetical protein
MDHRHLDGMNIVLPEVVISLFGVEEVENMSSVGVIN